MTALLLLTACGRGTGSSSQVDSLRSALSAERAADRRRVADSVQADALRPRELVLFSDPVVVAAPNKPISPGFAAFGFTLNSDGSCTLAGRLEVTAGGSGKDIQVLVFAHDAFVNWRNNGQGRPIYASPVQTITTLNVPVRQAGTYYLVLSNQMSIVSGKTVSGTATVTCIGAPMPANVP
jgi:hypothetical protein